MKVKMSNSNFIELSCELAHNRVPKSEIIENFDDYQTIYNEIGQDIFNEYYDYYQEILRTYIDEEL
tara:strand:- start:35 stop:232 length:198 start_codon:yes stop_codon:yes gene_type:complete